MFGREAREGHVLCDGQFSRLGDCMVRKRELSRDYGCLELICVPEAS